MAMRYIWLILFAAGPNMEGMEEPTCNFVDFQLSPSYRPRVSPTQTLSQGETYAGSTKRSR